MSVVRRTDRIRSDLKSDPTRWVLGPYHSALTAPLRLTLKLDGEMIMSASVESGFLHRGLEKAMELHPWQSTIAYADRLDPEAAAFGELALCLAVEEIGGIEVPERARAVRIILSELARISAHLGYLVRVARAVQGETLMHYVLRDRERILDLFELVSGARFSLNFLRFGGVKEDVTEGFIERVLEACETTLIRLKEYNDLFTYNQSFLRRTSGVGELPREWVERFGISGPNARASLVRCDVRKERPYCGYEKLHFDEPLGKENGDAHDRFLVRLREIAQSIEVLRQAVDTLPSGAYASRKVDQDFRLPAGEAYSRIESAHGLLGCHVVSDGGPRPSRIQFRPASRANIEALPKILEGIEVQDLPAVMASMDLAVAEADR